MQKETFAGLDIGRGYISAALARRSGDNHFRITHSATIETPKEMLAQDIAFYIKRLWKDLKIPVRTVCFCMQSQSVLLRHFIYEHLSFQELYSALKLEAEHAFQQPQHEIYLDSYIYPEALKDKDTSGKKEGIFAAAPKETVEAALFSIKKAGLYPVIMDIPAMAVASLYDTLNSQQDAYPLCLVNIRGQNYDFAIIGKDGRILPRSLYAQGNYSKQQEGLADNITDLLRYYQHKLGHEPVQSVVISGLEKSGDEIKQDITSRLGVKIRIWDPLDSPMIKTEPQRQKIEDKRPSIVALALAMRNGI